MITEEDKIALEALRDTIIDAVDMLDYILKTPTVIISRHVGAVDWLRKRGVKGEVVTHATIDDVKGKDVYGVLPFHLAHYARRMFAVSIPDLPEDRRGDDLTIEEMEEYGARLVCYKVEKE